MFACAETVLVTRNGLSPQKLQIIHDRPVIRVALFDVDVSSGEVSTDKTKTGVVILQTNAHGALVARHAAHTCLREVLVCYRS